MWKIIKGSWSYSKSWVEWIGSRISSAWRGIKKFPDVDGVIQGDCKDFEDKEDNNNKEEGIEELYRRLASKLAKNTEASNSGKSYISLGKKNLLLNLKKEDYETVKKSRDSSDKCCVYVKLLNGDMYYITTYDSNKFRVEVSKSEFTALHIVSMREDTLFDTSSTLPEIMEKLDLNNTTKRVYISEISKDPIIIEVAIRVNLEERGEKERYRGRISDRELRMSEREYQDYFNQSNKQGEEHISEKEREIKELVDEFCEQFKTRNSSITKTTELTDTGSLNEKDEISECIDLGNVTARRRRRRLDIGDFYKTFKIQNPPTTEIIKLTEDKTFEDLKLEVAEQHIHDNQKTVRELRQLRQKLKGRKLKDIFKQFKEEPQMIEEEPSILTDDLVVDLVISNDKEK